MRKEFQIAPESRLVSFRSIADNIRGVTLDCDTTVPEQTLLVENNDNQIRVVWNDERLTFDVKQIEAFDIVPLHTGGQRFLAATLTFKSDSESLRYSFIVIHESFEAWLRDLAEGIGDLVGFPPVDLVDSV